jgi:hypothetical protein
MDCQPDPQCGSMENSQNIEVGHDDVILTSMVGLNESHSCSFVLKRENIHHDHALLVNSLIDAKLELYT